MKLLYISLAKQKANFKIGIFVEKNEILPVQGRVVDRERQIERDLWKLKRGETKRGKTMRIWEERKKQKEGRKLRAYRETVRQRRQNSCFPRLQKVKKKIIFMGDVMREREIVFQKKKKKLENIPYKISIVFIRVFHWLKIVFRWLIFFCATKH